MRTTGFRYALGTLRRHLVYEVLRWLGWLVFMWGEQPADKKPMLYG